ncbi:MAG: S8 family serine peptidase, partial [Chloroflexi bacterium]|nr:S8 family serine peptidase [Chloroflexota bacterium]
GFSPANHPDVITVSAMVDTDGIPGGLGSSTSYGADDTFASFSNFGSLINIAAPGVSILSTYMGGGTATMSGTSMASPHVAGAAALYLVLNSGASPADVQSALVSASTPQDGTNAVFTGDPDNYPERLLNVANGGTPPPPPAELVLVSIEVTPASAIIEEGQTQQYVAIGSYDNDSTADITADVTWTSSDEAVASIDSSGLATGLTAGSAGITATQGAISSAAANLDVTPAPEAGDTVGVTSITYATSGGKNGDKHLFVTISVADDLGNPVESASVSITLTNGTSGESWIGTGATGAEGSVTFKLGNFPPGCYSTVVTDIIADGLTWDGNPGSDVEQQPFCKTSSGNGKGNSGALQVQ